jgi:hypothetical protein
MNQKLGKSEMQQPQYVLFDVYRTTSFGDMRLGSEYGNGNDTCNFLITGGVGLARPQQASHIRFKF